MTAPRLEIDLFKLQHNARTLVNLLAKRGISVWGVTKATLGLPEYAEALLTAGVAALADSRLTNIQTMRNADVSAPMALIRSPMISEATSVVANTDVSLNTELDVISALSNAARVLGRNHKTVLMVELGDLREGIMPADLEDVVRRTLSFPNIVLEGIGTNLACRCGVVPDAANMGELSTLVDTIEAKFGVRLNMVSGGNSANLAWALGGADTGRVNNLRLGEAILLGCDPLQRQPIEGLYTDAFTLVAEVIESKIKPSTPWGAIGEAAFGVTAPTENSGNILQAILALGQVDTEPAGLTPPLGIEILGSSSDHLIVSSQTKQLLIGAEVSFGLSYSSLIRAATSPFVTKKLHKISSESSGAKNQQVALLD